MNKLNLRYAEQQNTATAYHTPILMTSCFVYEPFQSFDNLLSFLKIECEAEEQITNQIMIMSSLHILIDIKEVLNKPWHSHILHTEFQFWLHLSYQSL